MSSYDADFVGASSQGFNPFPDSETVNAERRAIAAEVTKNIDVLGDIIETLDEQIKFYSSVDAIPTDVQTKPEEFMHVVAANRITKENIAAIKDSIEGLIAQAKK